MSRQVAVVAGRTECEADDLPPATKDFEEEPGYGGVVRGRCNERATAFLHTQRKKQSCSGHGRKWGGVQVDRGQVGALPPSSSLTTSGAPRQGAMENVPSRRIRRKVRGRGQPCMRRLLIFLRSPPPSSSEPSPAAVPTPPLPTRTSMT